jgi:diguanylate cyclase (GGDEF)-like protein
LENVHVLTRQKDNSGNVLPYGQIYSQNKESSLSYTLVTKLQKSLELNTLLTIFSEEVARSVDFEDLQFHSSDAVVKISDNKTVGKDYSFDLIADGEYLGQLVYFCHNLSTYAKQKLIKLHTLLVYPLRNALEFLRIKKLATKDALTSLNNRSQFDDNLFRKLEHSRRHQNKFGLMLLDLDNFKQVNDCQGHQFGDRILVEFANILTQCVRGIDTVFRHGGDEFAILIDANNLDVSGIIANRIRDRVHQNQLLKEQAITTSIGFTLYKENDTAKGIFERADQALYAAKNNGRDCCETA